MIAERCLNWHMADHTDGFMHDDIPAACLCIAHHHWPDHRQASPTTGYAQPINGACGSDCCLARFSSVALHHGAQIPSDSSNP